METGRLPRLLFTKEEAAEILALKVSAINGLLRNNEIPRHVIKGKLRFTMQDLETIVEMSAAKEME